MPQRKIIASDSTQNQFQTQSLRAQRRNFYFVDLLGLLRCAHNDDIGVDALRNRMAV